MNGENQPLVRDEPVEFEKWPVEVQGFKKNDWSFRGVLRIYLQIIK